MDIQFIFNDIAMEIPRIMAAFHVGSINFSVDIGAEEVAPGAHSNAGIKIRIAFAGA